VGGSIPADGNDSTWASNAIAEPQAIRYTLVQLDELVTRRNFPADRNIVTKRENLKKALAAYCQELADEGMISHCPLNRPTRPPNPEFGGMFQTDDCNRINIPNERTKDLNCPAGFTARMAFRFYSPDSGCAASLSYCFNGNLKTRTIFGGMFQQRQDGHIYSNNPLTGGNSCPQGFTSHYMAAGLSPDKRPHLHAEQHRVCNWLRIFWWEHSARHILVDQHDILSICLPTAFVQGQSVIGGFFQQNDNEAHNNVDNPFTGTRSCPVGYRQLRVGRIRVPGGNRSGSTLVMCLLQGWNVYFQLMKDDTLYQNDLDFWITIWESWKIRSVKCRSCL
jgi:hypothetical protein